MMHYAYLDMFWPCGLAGSIAALAMYGLFRKRQALRRLAAFPAMSPLLLVSKVAQRFKVALLLTATTLLGLVLLGPQWGQTVEEVPPSTKGRDVVLLLDVSRSMLAEDASPNRIESAKNELRRIMALLEQRGGYRVSLIAFADRACQLCPFTSDYQALAEELDRATLESIRLRGDLAGENGTEIGAALRRARAAIHPEAAGCTDIVLISDGGDMDKDTLAAADELGKDGITVHAIGIGNPTGEGALIPVRLANGSRTHLRYKGESVRTKLEETVLREVAQRTKGQYLAAGTGLLNLDPLAQALTEQRPTRELASNGPQAIQWIHRYQWFLAPALGLLALEMLLRDTRRPAATPAVKPQPFSWVKRRSETEEKSTAAA